MNGILAQVDPTSGLGTTLAPWANLTAVAALIFFLGWLLVRTLPRIMDAQRQRDQLFADTMAHVVARGEERDRLTREHNERQVNRLLDRMESLPCTAPVNGNTRGDRGSRG